jgi:hypothetical protein
LIFSQNRHTLVFKLSRPLGAFCRPKIAARPGLRQSFRDDTEGEKWRSIMPLPFLAQANRWLFRAAAHMRRLKPPR